MQACAASSLTPTHLTLKGSQEQSSLSATLMLPLTQSAFEACCKAGSCLMTEKRAAKLWRRLILSAGSLAYPTNQRSYNSAWCQVLQLPGSNRLVHLLIIIIAAVWMHDSHPNCLNAWLTPKPYMLALSSCQITGNLRTLDVVSSQSGAQKKYIYTL